MDTITPGTFQENMDRMKIEHNLPKERFPFNNPRTESTKNEVTNLVKQGQCIKLLQNQQQKAPKGNQPSKEQGGRIKFIYYKHE